MLMFVPKGFVPVIVSLGLGHTGGGAVKILRSKKIRMETACFCTRRAVRCKASLACHFHLYPYLDFQLSLSIEFSMM